MEYSIYEYILLLYNIGFSFSHFTSQILYMHKHLKEYITNTFIIE